ncbi:DUF6551 family protein [Streptomyces sp. NPDC096339]|uniref:DUF6551 family protein n=1 Tax=Streptomyces sp. NPDC096339 TaxID=3366086 RepID=UPI00380944C5
MKAWANKLDKEWNPDYLLPALVSLRKDGFYYLIDGQHSTHVAKIREGESFKRDCMVYEGLSLDMEARLFLAANRDRKAVRPLDTHHVALTARDEIAVRIDEEVTSCGLTVNSGTTATRVGAVQALQYLAKTEGMIRTVLTCAEEAWGRRASSWDGTVLRALGMIIEKNGEVINRDRLVKVMGEKTVQQWKSQAIVKAMNGGGSSSRSKPLANDIIARYNNRLTTTTKLEAV